MRIIAGKFGGHTIKSPKGHKTHPMNEKGRGALFNALGDIDDLTVLDAFAGSGAIGIEAISRGAQFVLMIDDSKQAQLTIADNIKELGVRAQAKLVSATANAWLSTSDQSFDLVILDPPFEKLQKPLLTSLASRTKVGGLTILSLPPNEALDLGADFEKLQTKKYGDNQLVFYRKIK